MTKTKTKTKAKTLHAVAAEVHEIDIEELEQLSSGYRGVIDWGQEVYEATGNPAYAYEVVAICLRHAAEVPKWAATVVAKGLEDLLTAAVAGKAINPLRLLGLRRRSGHSWLPKYKKEMEAIFAERSRSRASQARDKKLRRKVRPDYFPNGFSVNGRLVWPPKARRTAR